MKNTQKDPNWLTKSENYCPEGMLGLGVVGMHLVATSLLWLGIFQMFFKFKCCCLMASSVGVVGNFLTILCNEHFRKNQECFRQTLQHPTTLQICGGHTFGRFIWFHNSSFNFTIPMALSAKLMFFHCKIIC